MNKRKRKKVINILPPLVLTITRAIGGMIGRSCCSPKQEYNNRGEIINEQKKEKESNKYTTAIGLNHGHWRYDRQVLRRLLWGLKSSIYVV
jgi:hypothetical protein